MKSRTHLLTIIAILTISVLPVFANNAYDAAANALSVKLRKDFAVSNIEIKFIEVKTYQSSKNLIGLKGRGIANEMTIDFDVKLTKNKFVPTSVNYNIYEPDFAPAVAEDQINRDILEKIHNDYKTSNIVLAVDYFDSQTTAENTVKTLGVGEVSVNFQWRKINFEIVRDAKTNLLLSVKYQLVK